MRGLTHANNALTLRPWASLAGGTLFLVVLGPLLHLQGSNFTPPSHPRDM